MLIPDIVDNIFDVLAHPLSLDCGLRNPHESIAGELESAFCTVWGECLYMQAELEAKRSLAACALVSRTWASLAAPYLFQTMALRFRSPSHWVVARTLEDIDLWMHVSSASTRHIKKLRLLMLSSPRSM